MEAFTNGGGKLKAYGGKRARAGNYHSLLPDINLPLNLPPVQHQPPHSFSVKDHHLLKPPPVMGQVSSFGRRASDGGANLHMCYPPGTTSLTEDCALYALPNTGSSSAGATMGSETTIGPSAPDPTGAVLDDPSSEAYNTNLSRYMMNRGNKQRHTVATAEDVHNAVSHSPAPSSLSSNSPTSSSNIRTRRTGLLTVTERPPVISPELVMEVEARMKRNYLPPSIQTKQQAAPTYHPTVQQQNGSYANQNQPQNANFAQFPMQGTSFGPGMPNLQPGTGMFQPGTPTFQPGTSMFQPGTPTFQPGTSMFQPGAPMFQPGMPMFQPGTPMFQPGVPNFQTGMSMFQPGTANFQPGISNFQPGTSMFQASSSSSPQIVLQAVGALANLGSIQSGQPPRKYSNHGPHRCKLQTLATVQEMAREHSERYSPVRRCSDGQCLAAMARGAAAAGGGGTEEGAAAPAPPDHAQPDVTIRSARQEYQMLQRGLERQRQAQVTPSPPLLDTNASANLSYLATGSSSSVPGSPIHQGYQYAPGNASSFQRMNSAPEARSQLLTAIQSSAAIDISVLRPDLVQGIVRGLEQALRDNRVNLDSANRVLQTGHLPQEMAQTLGVTPQIIADNLVFNPQSPYRSRDVSPVQYSADTSPINLSASSSVNSGLDACSGGSPFASRSADVSPHRSSRAGMNTGSPLHQITQGISFLNTTGVGGSITKGTPQLQNALPLDLRSPAALRDSTSDPADLSMDTTPVYAQQDWQYAAGQQFLPMVHPQVHMVSVAGAHRSLNNSPISNPGSPGLDMIREEITGAHNANIALQNNVQFVRDPVFLNNYDGIPQIVLPPDCNPLLNQFAPNQLANAQNHPQISLTDCLGSEITLVASSSEDSMDSLENNPEFSQFRAAQDLLPQFIISEPSDFEDRPSIMKGIGRKTSQENETAAKNRCNAFPSERPAPSESEKPVVSENPAEVVPETPFPTFGNQDLISPDCDRSNQLFLAQNPNSDEAKYARRGSDKSLGFSDDSLSNDSNHSANVSPNCEQNVTSLYSNIVSISSGFSENRGSFSEHRESFSERAGSEYRGSFSDRGSFSERGDFGRSSFSDLGTRSSFSEKGETPRSSFSAQGAGCASEEYPAFMSRDSSRTGLSGLEKCEEEDSLCMQGDIDKLQKSTLDLRISEDSLKDEPSARTNEYFEVTLSDVCSEMDSSRILEVLKDVINTRVPPQNIFVFKNSGDSGGGAVARKGDAEGVEPGSGETLNLNLEYSGGVQIELVVCEGKAKNKGLKMRRISGDQCEYGKLCQQLISSLTV